MTSGVRLRAAVTEPGLRSVLAALDLTPSSDRVLGRLARLPLAEDAKVTLLHVVPASLPARQRRAAERDARRALDIEAADLRRSLPARVTVKTLTVSGVPVKAIGVVATKASAELVLVGRGNGRALRDAFLGSTAERLLRETRRPVMLVRLAPRARYQRPALAVELDQAAPEAVRLLLRLLPPPRPRVAVIHAYEVPHVGGVYPSLSGEDERRGIDTQRKAGLAVTELLRSAVAKAKGDAPAWKLYLKEGSPRVIVEKATRNLETDLLVLGTRGSSGVAALFLGSVAGDLLRDVKCDVLVVPPARARS